MDSPQYIGEMSLAAVERPEAVQRAKVAMFARQRAFLKRKSHQSGCAVQWRPRKRHRKASYQHSIDHHNQLLMFLADGLLHFQVTEWIQKNVPAIQWARYSYCPDMCSSNIASVCHWIHKLKLCCDLPWGFAHPVCNDIINGCKLVELYDHLALAMLRLNAAQSPYQQDVRWRQFTKAKEELLELVDARKAPLFDAFLEDLLEDEDLQQFAQGDNPKAERSVNI